MTRNEPWYRRYSELRREVERLRNEFNIRCEVLGANPGIILSEFRKDIIARAVHESNWQEGLYLDTYRTQELAEVAFGNLPEIKGPHLDMDLILEQHRKEVIKLKKQNSKPEEIAAYNLSLAHVALHYMHIDLGSKQSTSLVYALKQFEEIYPKISESIPTDSRRKIEEGFHLVHSLISEDTHVNYPISVERINPEIRQGEYLSLLLDLDFESLLNPMHVSYIHFLHRITLMGIIPPSKLGEFRKTAVFVGDFDQYFPPPSAIASMMEEFCKDFPTLLSTRKYDVIKKSAEVAYKFVRIHPYCDGNGRVSRLLMNLVLFPDFPPVYLKADKKGRHRYIQALRRANRGDITPLSTLISMSLIEIYTKLLNALNTHQFPKTL